jgi:hypothetical protein
MNKIIPEKRAGLPWISRADKAMRKRLENRHKLPISAHSRSATLAMDQRRIAGVGCKREGAIF